MITASSPTFLGLITMTMMLLAYMVIIQMVWVGLISLKQPDDDPTKANGKTEGLKPHFYVLNNLLRATIDQRLVMLLQFRIMMQPSLFALGLRRGSV